MRFVTRVLLVAVLLLPVSLQAVPAQAGGVQAKRVWQSLVSKAKGAVRVTQAVALAGALLATVPAAINAQEVLEPDEIHWMDVHEAHHSAAIALQSIPAEEDGTPKLYTVAYVGDTDGGDAIVVGLGLDGDRGIDTELSYQAYSTDGLLADNVQVEDIGFFDIGMEGFSQTNALVVKGLSLAARYEPVRLAEFPVDDVGGELTMVTYWSGAEENFAFPIARLRTCEIGESGNWGKHGIGLTTCSPSAAFRSVIYYGNKSVGFHGGSSREFIFVEGISDGLLRFVRGVQGLDTLPVEARGKLATTWAELKKQ